MTNFLNRGVRCDECDSSPLHGARYTCDVSLIILVFLYTMNLRYVRITICVQNATMGLLIIWITDFP